MVEVLEGKPPVGIDKVTTSNPALVAAGKIIPALSLATPEGRTDLANAASMVIPVVGAYRMATDEDFRQNATDSFVGRLSPEYQRRSNEEKIKSQVERILAEREVTANNAVSFSRN
jgi:hypothetical protein